MLGPTLKQRWYEKGKSSDTSWSIEVTVLVILVGIVGQLFRFSSGRFGSLAASLDNISLTAAFGGKADVHVGQF
jgi:hypothetical protein